MDFAIEKNNNNQPEYAIFKVMSPIQQNNFIQISFPLSYHQWSKTLIRSHLFVHHLVMVRNETLIDNVDYV